MGIIEKQLKEREDSFNRATEDLIEKLGWCITKLDECILECAKERADIMFAMREYITEWKEKTK